MAGQKASTATVLPVTDTALMIGEDGGTSGVFSGANVARYMANRIRNQNSAIQAISAATLTKINGSDLAVPTGKNIVVGVTWQWQIIATKTAAGIAARTFYVRLGTLGTTADTAIATFTSPAGTAAADVAYIEIIAICLSIAANVATFEVSFSLAHNLASTGFSTTSNQLISPPTSTATLNISTAGLIATLSLTSGASEAITVRQIFSQVFGL